MMTYKIERKIYIKKLQINKEIMKFKNYLSHNNKNFNKFNN